MSLGMAAGVLLAGGMATPAHAVTPVACTEAALRTAIDNSNAGSGDTLSLIPYCVYTLTDVGGGALPTITQPLVIQGNNATIKRDTAASNFRIFDVGATSLQMSTLTVMNGRVTGDSGGGVLVTTSGGSLTATDVNFQGNSAVQGGAIFTANSTSVSLTGGTVNDNRATVDGGGIWALGATTVTLTSVNMTDNRASGDGGGAYLNTSTPTTFINSTISHNTAQAAGGGIFYAGNNLLSVTGTTIADNRVTASTSGGGGILFVPSGGTGMITGSTISGNTVTGFTNDTTSNRGGGIHSEAGALTLNNTQVTGNQLVGAFGQGAGIATDGSGTASTLTLQNGTTLTRNLASGQYSQGGGLYTDNTSSPVTVMVDASHIDANKVTGTGSAAAGIYNNGSTYSFTTASSVNNNLAPAAPAPGGVYTTVAINSVDGATFTGNTPTNCVFSPQPVTNCIG
ncbi:beta strand repeat-containing protein [Streptomyces sp. NPDC086787]|uniref:beta strand repeat-containing protein n=1 Tax=Streptomyces sp. NPDC086787 TaxID=3365759 RepID=UPI00380E9F04